MGAAAMGGVQPMRPRPSQHPPAGAVMPAMVGELLHRSGNLYEPGDEVQPGNWGRVIMGAGLEHSSFQREYIFESVRKQHFSEKPSRMRASFACETFEALNAVRPTGYDYRAEFADANSNLHRGDLGWFEVLRECRTFEGIDQCARNYWSSVPLGHAPHWELLAECPLRIVRRLTSIFDDRVRW